MAHTSAAELFHRFIRSEGVLHSENLSLRQQMHQTATTKTTYSANHQNITGICMMQVKCMKTSTSRPYNSYVWILSRKAHFVNISIVCEPSIMNLHKVIHQLNCTFIHLKIPYPLLTQCSLISPLCFYLFLVPDNRYYHISVSVFFLSCTAFRLFYWLPAPISPVTDIQL